MKSWCNPFPYQLQEVASDDGFCQLVCSSEYEFLLECGITKPVMKMNLTDKEKVVSAVRLHYAVLSSLAELEQLKRGLQTVRFTLLMERYACCIPLLMERYACCIPLVHN